MGKQSQNMFNVLPCKTVKDHSSCYLSSVIIFAPLLRFDLGVYLRSSRPHNKLLRSNSANAPVSFGKLDERLQPA